MFYILFAYPEFDHIVYLELVFIAKIDENMIFPKCILSAHLITNNEMIHILQFLYVLSKIFPTTKLSGIIFLR